MKNSILPHLSFFVSRVTHLFHLSLLSLVMISLFLPFSTVRQDFH